MVPTSEGNGGKDLTPEPSVIGPYRVVRLLGRGAMGSVYEAERDGARVALKLMGGLSILSARDPGLVARFEREARVCAAFDDPHIVRVRDFGVHEGVPFLTMDLLRGKTLEAWVDELGPLAPEVATAIVQQVCEGLEAAHARGIIHRDLKPSNLFVDELPDGELRVVICDFGTAKVYDEDGALTASGSVLGTPLYMSPEQLSSSRRVDARADVWALGMTLYHALAGSAALSQLDSIPQLILALADGRIPPLQAVAPWVQPRLARAVHAALLPLDKRVPSVHAFADALAGLGAPLRLEAKMLVPLSDTRRGQRAEQAAIPASYEELADEASGIPSLAGKVLSGGYRVVKRLGVGGMGAVYEGRAPNGAEVALKVMHADLAKNAEGARRFVRESRAVRKLDSPYVAKLIDEGTDEATKMPFLVMELLKGQDLAAMVRARGPLEPGPAARLFVEACRGVAAAHALGIVHRDIKPSNLFVHDAGGEVCAKVCDFGIAKQSALAEAGEASTELTRSGGMLGSPMYMSPEQARNAKLVDARSDVWSLAISLYEVLTGQRPWPGRGTMGELILAICTEEMPPLRDIAPWVDPALAAVVHKGLAKDPSERWPSAEALGDALAPFAKKGALGHADLEPVPQARRATGHVVIGSAPGSLSMGIARTSPSVSEAPAATPARRGRWIAAGAALLVVAVAGLGTGVASRSWGERSGPHATTTAAPSAPASASASVPATALTAVQTTITTAASASSSPDAAVGAASAATIATGARAVRRGGKTAPQDTASAAVTASAAPAASGVGRGGTATDVSFGQPQGAK